MKVLLVVDLQPEFRDNDGQYERILEFVRTTKNYDRIIATKCFNLSSSPFIKYNAWHDCLGEVKELEFTPYYIIGKSTYGLVDYDILDKDWEYDIIGFNTDSCVFKIAMDMFDRKYDFKVLTQYCYSSNGLKNHLRGKDVLRANLGTAFIE